MKVVIIDDEPLARTVVKEYLQKYPDMEIMEECGNGFDGLKAIQKHRPDVVFLDIQMPKISGFEMLELVDNVPAVIFTTAFEAYALKAFDASATDYLLKPFSQERFDTSIQKLLQQTPGAVKENTQTLLDEMSLSPGQKERIVVKDKNKIKIIPLSQVQYVESADDYVKIYTAEGNYLKNKTMQTMEQLLPKAQFVRIHRSCIANIALITRIDPYEKDGHILLLSTGARLAVSKAGYSRLREVLGI